MNEYESRPCFFIMANGEPVTGMGNHNSKNGFMNYPPLKLLKINENWIITIFDNIRNNTNENKSWPQYQLFNVKYTKKAL